MAKHLTNPGDYLANGAALLDRAAAPRYGADCHIVLAVALGSYTPFVTWVEDDRGELFWGHYHRTLDAALADWAERVSA